jgi:RNA polymerase sigma-70 factor (ECF subfamily)
METTMEQVTEDGAALAAARAGDEVAFSGFTERYRNGLRAHAYRMLGSFDDAEDMVQETFLRAWRRRETFEGRSTLRAWLYGISTNACLDFLRKHEDDRKPTPSGELLYLQPYPDRLLEPAVPRSQHPDAAAAARENIGLAYLVALQYLPAKQRAALILCDVLDWSAKEAAELLDMSVASINSALQRARATLRERQPELRPEWQPGLDPDEQQRSLLERYIAATERGDTAGLAGLLKEDVRFSMPPHPGTWTGRDNVVNSWVEGGFGSDWFGEFRCLLTRANGMPAVAAYVRKPGQTKYHALGIDVLVFEDGLIKEITTFCLAPVVKLFDLPAEL